jgi:Fe-S-cluster containining protein
VKAKDRLKVFEDKPEMKVYGLGKQRVRCPFLSDREECSLYDKRPIICRIYGVPFSLMTGDKERSYVCNISGFQEKVTYPTVKLYKIYNELCKLSEELFKKVGSTHPEKVTLMLPLSRVIRMPFETLIKGDFEE